MPRTDHRGNDPVFLDRSGRRRSIAVASGAALGAGLLAGLILLVTGLFGASPLHLPGLPGLPGPGREEAARVTEAPRVPVTTPSKRDTQRDVGRPPGSRRTPGPTRTATTTAPSVTAPTVPPPAPTTAAPTKQRGKPSGRPPRPTKNR